MNKENILRGDYMNKETMLKMYELSFEDYEPYEEYMKAIKEDKFNINKKEAIDIIRTLISNITDVENELETILYLLKKLEG